jgi:hypothetical protein
MYFAYGWPRAFDVGGSTASEAPHGGGDILGGYARDAASAAGADAAHAIVQILADDDTIVILTGSSVQVACRQSAIASVHLRPCCLSRRLIECAQGRFTLEINCTTVSPQVWSGGMHRIRLGAAWRSPGAVQTEGANKRGFWSSSRRLLAVIVGFSCTRRLLVSGVCQQRGHTSKCLRGMALTTAGQKAYTAGVDCADAQQCAAVLRCAHLQGGRCAGSSSGVRGRRRRSSQEAGRLPGAQHRHRGQRAVHGHCRRQPGAAARHGGWLPPHLLLARPGTTSPDTMALIKSCISLWGQAAVHQRACIWRLQPRGTACQF